MARKWEKILDEGVVLLFMIALMGYMPTARSSDRLVWVGTLALLLLRTAWLAVKREVHFSLDINLFFYILVFTWAMCSCFWSMDIRDFKTYATVAFPAGVCAVLCLTAYIGQRIDPDRFLHLMIFSGLVAGIRYCIYTDWSGLLSDYYLRGSFGRLLDDVTNYNAYTMIVSIACILALYASIVKHERKWILPAVALTVILLMGGSRKNIVAVPMIALLFSFFSGNGAKKAKILLIILLILAVGIYCLQTVPALSQISSAMEGMFNGMSDDEDAEVDGSTAQRMFLMQEGIRVWTEHPLIGVGWNNFRYYNETGLYAHNNYVEMLASFGIIGFLLYYAMFIRVGYLLCSAFWNKRVQKEDILLLGFSINMLIVEIGSITLYFKERMILLLVIFYWHSYTTGRKTYQFLFK